MSKDGSAHYCSESIRKKLDKAVPVIERMMEMESDKQV